MPPQSQTNDNAVSATIIPLFAIGLLWILLSAVVVFILMFWAEFVVPAPLQVIFVPVQFLLALLVYKLYPLPFKLTLAGATLIGNTILGKRTLQLSNIISVHISTIVPSRYGLAVQGIVCKDTDNHRFLLQLSLLRKQDREKFYAPILHALQSPQVQGSPSVADLWMKWFSYRNDT